MNKLSCYIKSMLKILFILSPEYTKYEMYLINKAYDKSSYEKTLGTFEASKEFAYKSFFECKKSISSLIP